MNEEELYADETEAEAKPEAEKESPKTEKADKDEGQTTLISKKSIGIPEGETLKPGYKCEFEVVKDYGGEVEFKKVHKKQPTEDEELDMLSE